MLFCPPQIPTGKNPAACINSSGAYTGITPTAPLPVSFLKSSIAFFGLLAIADNSFIIVSTLLIIFPPHFVPSFLLKLVHEYQTEQVRSYVDQFGRHRSLHMVIPFVLVIFQLLLHLRNS